MDKYLKNFNMKYKRKNNKNNKNDLNNEEKMIQYLTDCYRD